jgi:osmotically-inducible protein OsmY
MLNVKFKKLYNSTFWRFLMNSLNVKKIGKYLSALMAVAAMVSLVACASTSKHEGTGEYVDDSVITTKVKAAILKEPSLKVLEINVETFKGVVQLSGFVHDSGDASKAAKIASDVSGVVSVKNDIRVK